MLASLDVENLFTNVPVQDTLNIIILNVYDNHTMPPAYNTENDDAETTGGVHNPNSVQKYQW